MKKYPIGIACRWLTSFDAVSNDVLGMYETLKKANFPVKIFADSWNLNTLPINSISEINSFLTHKYSILIYHLTSGWNAGLQILKKINCKKVIRYHNITPPSFYHDINEEYFIRAQQGLKNLEEIKHLKINAFFANSNYSLKESGIQNGNVLYPFHKINEIIQAHPHKKLLKKLQDGNINLLSIGRISPHKNQIDTLKAFATYNKNINPKSRLIIVGKEKRELSPYNLQLKKIIQELNLSKCLLHLDTIDTNKLKSCYLASHIFLTTSLHEGFCVPLAESMAFKLPIIALENTAIPETTAHTGIIWQQNNPLLLATSINYLVQNQSFRNNLIQKGLHRFEKYFSKEVLQQTFLRNLTNL